MSLTTLTLGSLLTLLGMLLFLGAAPVFAVRLITMLYPKVDPRRAELIAEMAHVQGLRAVPRQWLWLGDVFAASVCEGPSLRWQRRRRRRRNRAVRKTFGSWSAQRSVDEELAAREFLAAGQFKSEGKLSAIADELAEVELVTPGEDGARYDLVVQSKLGQRYVLQLKGQTARRSRTN